jgi:hypothetical protein
MYVYKLKVQHILCDAVNQLVLLYIPATQTQALQ